MSHRRLVLAAGASVVVLLSASPAFAAWSVNGAGAAAAKGAAFTTITLTDIGNGGSKCQGANHKLEIDWTAPAGTPAAATVNILRGTSAGAESATPIDTAAVGDLKYLDGNANGTFYYKVQVAAGTNWRSSVSNELHASC